MQTVTFKAPKALLKKVEKIANLQERSKSHLIRKAIEAYLRELEEDEADYRIALERLNDPKAEYIPWEVVEKQLGLDR